MRSVPWCTCPAQKHLDRSWCPSAAFSVVWHLRALACPKVTLPVRCWQILPLWAMPFLHAGWEPEEASLTAWPWQLAWAGKLRLSLALLCPAHPTWPLSPASIIWEKWKGFPTCTGTSKLLGDWKEGPAGGGHVTWELLILTQSLNSEEALETRGTYKGSLLGSGVSPQGCLEGFFDFIPLGYDTHDVPKVHLRVYGLYKTLHVYSVESAGATITTYHRLGGLNSTNLFSHSFGDRKSKSKMSARSVSSAALSFGYRWLPSHCALMDRE